MNSIKSEGRQLGTSADTGCLTQPEGWLRYWQEHLKLPKRFNSKSPASRCIAKELTRHLAGCEDKLFVELGCCPGKWMAFVHDTFGLNVSGIDYLDVGIDLTSRNLTALGVPYDNLWTGDIIGFDPPLRFDVVFSKGLVEHFEDLDLLLGKHILWLKPGGIAIIVVPHFTGCLGYLQAWMDRSLRTPLLPEHNPEVADHQRYVSFCRNREIELLSCRYIGGPMPSLAMAGKGKTERAVLRMLKWLRLCTPALDRVNGSLVSNYTFVVIRKYGSGKHG